MGEISHQTVAAKRISMHLAEKGDGPAVLLPQDFPELRYSWCRQVLGLTACGYYALAPDLSSYDNSSAPAPSASYTILHIVTDVVALLDALT